MEKKRMKAWLTVTWALCIFAGIPANDAANEQDHRSLEPSNGSRSDSIVISTLQDAEKLAFQSNIDIANARVDIKMMAQRRLASESALLPQVTAGGNATDITNIPTTIIPGGLLPGYPGQTAVALGVQYGATATIQAKQKLFDASSIVALKTASAT
jgi:hypothetical protein